MANKWVDAEGTEHRGSPPQGWWMANDNRWYPPQQPPAQQPSPQQLPAQQAPVLQPQAQPPSAPTTGEEQASKKKAWWKTKKAIAVWAILGIAVLVNVSGGTDTEGETASAATETSTSESSQAEASATGSEESANEGSSNEDSSAEASAEKTTTTAEPTTTTTEATTTTTIETTTTTQPPEPVVLSGTGDQVVTVEKPANYVLAEISHSGGGGNFAIVSYDAAGGRLDLLVNVIGTYEGRVLVDIGDEQTSALEVTASGPWTVTYYPLTEARVESGSTITGVGDDVFLLDEETSGLTTGEFSTDGGGNFAIWGYTGSGRDLVVNEIGPYSGQGIVDQGTILFQVSAEAAWTVSLS